MFRATGACGPVRRAGLKADAEPAKKVASSTTGTTWRSSAQGTGSGWWPTACWCWTGATRSGPHPVGPVGLRCTPTTCRRRCSSKGLKLITFPDDTRLEGKRSATRSTRRSRSRKRQSGKSLKVCPVRTRIRGMGTRGPTAGRCGRAAGGAARAAGPAAGCSPRPSSRRPMPRRQRRRASPMWTRRSASPAAAACGRASAPARAPTLPARGPLAASASRWDRYERGHPAATTTVVPGQRRTRST